MGPLRPLRSRGGGTEQAEEHDTADRSRLSKQERLPKLDALGDALGELHCQIFGDEEHTQEEGQLLASSEGVQCKRKAEMGRAWRSERALSQPSRRAMKVGEVE